MADISFDCFWALSAEQNIHVLCNMKSYECHLIIVSLVVLFVTLAGKSLAGKMAVFRWLGGDLP